MLLIFLVLLLFFLVAYFRDNLKESDEKILKLEGEKNRLALFNNERIMHSNRIIKKEIDDISYSSGLYFRNLADLPDLLAFQIFHNNEEYNLIFNISSNGYIIYGVTTRHFHIEYLSKIDENDPELDFKDEQMPNNFRYYFRLYLKRNLYIKNI